MRLVRQNNITNLTEAYKKDWQRKEKERREKQKRSHATAKTKQHHRQNHTTSLEAAMTEEAGGQVGT